MLLDNTISMEDFDRMIRDIGDNIQKLIGQRDSAKRELSVLIEEKNRLQLENDENRQRLRIKEEQMSAQKMGHVIGSAGDLQSTRKKVMDIIREIDTCIKLLDD